MAYSKKDFTSKGFKESINKYEDARRDNVCIYIETEDLTDIAEYYYENGNISQAIEAIDYAVTLCPGATMPLIFRSRIALLDENNIEMAKQYAANVNDKRDLDYYYLLAEIMIVEENWDNAEAFLREKMDFIDDEDQPDFILDVAALFADYNLYDYAEEWLLMSDEYDLADYKELKGRIACGKGNYDEGETIFKELLDEDPYASQIWNNLSSAQLMNNDIKESISSSEFAIAINPKDDEAILNKANGLFSLGRYEEALEYYRRFTSIRPTEIIGYMFQANTLLNMNRQEEALPLYKKAEQMSTPNTPVLGEIYKNMALTLSALGNMNGALDYVDKLDSCIKGDKSEVMILRGHIYLENNKSEEAQECFRKAMFMTESPAASCLHIAISMYDCNYYNIAYKMFNEIPGFKQDKVKDGYSYMALCCKQLGKTDEFLEYLNKACKCNPYEAKLVLGHLFPENMRVEDYYIYMYNELKNYIN